jgi:hypothetical protein
MGEDGKNRSTASYTSKHFRKYSSYDSGKKPDTFFFAMAVLPLYKPPFHVRRGHLLVYLSV